MLKSIDVVVIGFSVYPNPTGDIVNINGSRINNGKYGIKVLDMKGRVVINKSVQVNNNTMTEPLSLWSLPEGVYMIVIQNSSEQHSLKILKIQ